MPNCPSKPIDAAGPQPPCQSECPKRSPTCHVECEAYQTFAKKREEYRQARFMENDIFHTVGRRYTAAFFDRKAKLKRDGRQVDR